MKTALTTYIVGWFGKATEEGHTSKSTKVHVVKNNATCLCGYRPHATMQLQWCTFYIEYGYIECSKCKKMAKKILTNNLNNKT